MKKVKYGIVGMGNQGTHYATKLFSKSLIDNGVLVAVCDTDKKKIDDLKSIIPNVNFYHNHIEMLDSGICDTVIITTPHYSHPQIAIDCFNRNINVLCDKPAGVYTKTVREMNEVAQKSNAKFTMMFNQRTNNLYQKMKEIISKGMLGDIQRVTWIITDWFRTQYYYETCDWRATWAGEGGGVLINQCPHQLDLIQWIIGELPEKVTSFCHYGKWHNIEVEDDVTAYFEYRNGATGVFISTTGETPGTNRLEISGTEGKLVCEDNCLHWHKNEVDSLEFSKCSKQGFAKPTVSLTTFERESVDPKKEQSAGIINNFTNYILGLEELFVKGIEGIESVELMNAIKLSGWQNGKTITLPVDEDEYLAELNKNIAISKQKQQAEK